MRNFHGPSSVAVLMAGGVLVFAGLILGFAPVNSPSGSCGSVFAPAQSDVGGVDEACAEARRERRLPVLVAAGGGAVTIGYGLLSGRRRHRKSSLA